MDIYIQNLILSKSINTHYAKRYIKFISNFLHQQQIKNETESHHILPKCKGLFPEYKSFYKNPWNKINLTKRQHFIAHWMLCKVFGYSQLKAFWLMCRGRKVIPSKLYEKLKKEQGKFVSEHMKNNKYSVGCKLSEENIELLREVNKKETMFISPDGIIYIHKGVKDFCNLHNLNYNCIRKVVIGKKSHWKGWKCKYVDNPYQEFKKLPHGERAKRSAMGHKKTINYTTPEGNHGTHKGMIDFCKTYNLNPDKVRGLINKEIDFYKGWIITTS